MKEETETKVKVCLVGDGGVGKTSLIKKYVFNEFDDRYLFTLGTSVSKKEMKLDTRKVVMLIWDIMGQKDLATLFVESYFKGAQGGIAVCDITDNNTLESLNEWIDGMLRAAGKIPITILANKNDLLDSKEIDEGRLKQLAEKYGATFYFTSAKTGENVERAFVELARRILGYKNDEH